MKNKLYFLFFIGVLIHLVCSCSNDWTKTIRSGEIEQHHFLSSVDLEIRNGLIFLPVTIQGEEYNFLWDSGAPFSISKQLQNKYAFQIVSKGNIRDSDYNKKQVKWTQVDSITIGNIDFMNQTAFVGDFEANPLLKCLNIDGIIGSNLMRHCVWTVDQEKNSLTLAHSVDQLDYNEWIKVPFTTDAQFNMYVDLNIGQATISNVLVDFGSNGSISLSAKIFTILKNRKIIFETLMEKGYQQSGIVGKEVYLMREIAYSDSIHLDEKCIPNVKLWTGKTVSVGNDFLSEFKVTIDWDNKDLYFLKTSKSPKLKSFAGFSLGYASDKGVYIRSIVENSEAHIKGIRPSMKVLKIDTLNFEEGSDFCDYVEYKSGNEIYLELMDSKGEKMEFYLEKMKL